MNRRSATAWFVVPLLVIGGCGSQPETTPDEASPTEELSQEEARVVELVAGSGELLLEEKSARVAMKMSTQMPEAAGGGAMTGTGSGAYDYEAKTGYLTVTMTQEALPQLGEMTMKTIMDLPFMYMNMTDMLRQYGGELPPQMKPWIRVNINEIGEQVGIDLGALMRFGQSDASSQALYTQGVVEVEEVGEEEVRGKPATHYSSMVDFDKLLETDLPEDVRSSLETVVRMMGTSRIPMDVWLDSSGRMVRQRLEMPMPLGPSGETLTNIVDTTYFDFGTDVEVDLPPERKVMDFEELLELAPDSGSGSQELAPPTDATSSLETGKTRA
ncbi:MAG: hypothetical protein M3174_04065 [Actinomycetota bacterium]|nr:hypothetical protein [Actinomycetota bacterium]